jgi:LPS sulfotransferase NodH
MKYLIVNAFPRSGSVFFASALNMAGIQEDVMMASLHLPHIIDNDRLMSAVVFRNPYDALASHTYMRFRQHNPSFGDLDTEPNKDVIKFYLEDYMTYVNYALENKGKGFLHIVDFEKMTTDTVGEINSLCEKFNLTYRNKISNEQIFSDIKNNFTRGNLMDDAQGHMPREKDSDRLKVEEFINKLSFIEEAYLEYKKLF